MRLLLLRRRESGDKPLFFFFFVVVVGFIVPFGGGSVASFVGIGVASFVAILVVISIVAVLVVVSGGGGITSFVGGGGVVSITQRARKDHPCLQKPHDDERDRLWWDGEACAVSGVPLNRESRRRKRSVRDNADHRDTVDIHIRAIHTIFTVR